VTGSHKKSIQDSWTSIHRTPDPKLTCSTCAIIAHTTSSTISQTAKTPLCLD